MPTKFAYSVLAAGFAIAVAGSAIAQDQRVLRVSKGICPAFKEQLFDWAGSVEGHGAYAVPALPAGQSLDCDTPSAVVPTSQSWGFQDQKAADFAAMAQCKSTLPEGYKRCVIVGQSFTR